MSRTIILSAVVFLCVAPSIQAEHIPLVEISYETLRFGGEGDPPMRDWEFGFSASLSAHGIPSLFAWFDFYGVDDIGKTFPAPEEIVQGAALALASPSTYYHMFTAGLANPSGPARLMDMVPPGGPIHTCICAQLFVPDPTIYRVTAMERVIDDLIVQENESSWIGGGNQIVRFLGEPIPEPASIFLLTIYGLIALFIRLQRDAFLSYPADTSGLR